MNQPQMYDTSAGTGKLCILGHLGLVFIWSCFVSCLLFLLFYVSLRNLCSGTCRKIQDLEESNDLTRKYVMEIFKVRIRFSKLFDCTKRLMYMKAFSHVKTTTTRLRTLT